MKPKDGQVSHGPEKIGDYEDTIRQLKTARSSKIYSGSILRTVDPALENLDRASILFRHL